MTPKLSVVLPAYNRAPWLGVALDSILAPGLDCEVVVVDNGSSDGTWDLLQRYAREDARVRAVRWEVNNGGEVYPSLLEMARGEYVTLFADDDEMLPGGLARKMALLDAHPEIGVVFSTVRIMNQEGADRGEMAWARIAEADVKGGWDAFGTLVLSNCVPMGAAMFRRALVPEGPDLLRTVAFQPSGDWQFWLDLARRTAFAYLREPTVRLRLHDGQVTQTHGVQNGGFVTGNLSILKYWMLEAQPPYIPSARAWEVHQLNLLSALRATHGEDEGAVQEGLRILQALRTEQDRRLEGSGEASGGQPEAFLFEPDWAGSAWVEVLLAYLEAFAPGDPVALVFVTDPAAGGLSQDQAQEAILQVVAATGRERFADVMLEEPAGLLGTLRTFPHIQWVPAEAGRVEGLTGALGQRLAVARQTLAGKERA